MRDGTWVGLDVHARSVVACALEETSGEVTIRRLAGQAEEVLGFLGGLPVPVRAAYEAGPTGFHLARSLAAAGIECVVAAPSRIPRAAADRVKTDRRDAERLARMLRLGDLVGLRVPEILEEAARDLVRAREDARGDLMRARHRLSKFCLRHGHVYPGSAWTLAHDAWLRRLDFPGPAERAFAHYYGAALAARSRRDELDLQIEELAGHPRFVPVVGRLRCLRGVSTLTALALAVEIGDWHRLSGASIGAYLGLVPGEHSSGEQRMQGSITKTGNGHARRLLVEAAWHQRRRPVPSAALERRRAGQRPEVIDRAERAARRLHRRWVRLEERRGKRPTVVAVAVARELAGWCWSLAVMDD